MLGYGVTRFRHHSLRLMVSAILGQSLMFVSEHWHLRNDSAGGKGYVGNGRPGSSGQTGGAIAPAS
jgi:hypothetical protein